WRNLLHSMRMGEPAFQYVCGVDTLTNADKARNFDRMGWPMVSSAVPGNQRGASGSQAAASLSVNEAPGRGIRAGPCKRGLRDRSAASMVAATAAHILESIMETPAETPEREPDR